MSSLRFLLRMLLPYRRATEDEARQAILDCGLSPDDLAWRVTEDGAFAFGRKTADANPPTEQQIRCLVDWPNSRRVRLAIIGWETTETEGPLPPHP